MTKHQGLQLLESEYLAHDSMFEKECRLID